MSSSISIDGVGDWRTFEGDMVAARAIAFALLAFSSSACKSAGYSVVDINELFDD